MSSIPSIVPPVSLPGTILSTVDPATSTNALTTSAESSASASTTPTDSISTSPSLSETPFSTFSTPPPPTFGPGPVSTPMSSSSHKSHAGAIAGGVVGGVALITVIIALILFLCYRRARSKRRNARLSQKWDGLSGGGDPSHGHVTNLPARHASTASTAHTVVQTDLGRKVSTSTSRLSEDHTTLAEDEKVPSTPSTLYGQKPFELIETVPPLPPLDNVRPPSVALVHDVTFASPQNCTRAWSTSENRAAALARLDAGAARRSPVSPTSPTSASWKRQSIDARVLASPTSPVSAISPRTAEMIKLNRTSSGARRAPRKAVPKYDETEFTSISPSSSPPEGNPLAAYESRNADSSSSNPAGRSKEDLEAAGYDVPNLTHKSSFGDMRPMHYLIPDLPPAQRD